MGWIELPQCSGLLPCLMAALSFDRAGTAPTGFRTIQVYPQGPAPWFGGRLMVRRCMRAICYPRRPTMKQQAVGERRDWGADITGVGLYSVLILVVTLLWVYIPA
jgi:hypothetical protein